MPVYEYYCPSCRSKFEQLRSMASADEPATCIAGHPGARRLLSAFVFGGRAVEQVAAPAMGGGCACGNGACGCGH